MPRFSLAFPVLLCPMVLGSGGESGNLPLKPNAVVQVVPQQAHELTAQHSTKTEAIKTLPDPFTFRDGSRVANSNDWQRRRQEIKAILAQYGFGQMPPAPEEVTAQQIGDPIPICDGTAMQRELRLTFGPDRPLSMGLTLTIPNGTGPFPVIVINRRSHPRSRIRPENLQASIRHGYILAEYAASDLQEDETTEHGPAKRAYPEYDWNTIAVWAWGGIRAIDYLVTRPEVAKDRILVTGHSRGGKTALLTGALDERVALTVPNASGGGGFQCWRFPIEPNDPSGVNRHESLALMNQLRAYWFGPRLLEFGGQAERLPFDQHFLGALVAPRALCVVESMDDNCATPICVQRSWLATRCVYAWMNATDKLGLYIRQRGGHAQGPEDWAALLDFADIVFNNKTPTGGKKFDALPYPKASPGFTWQAPDSK